MQKEGRQRQEALGFFFQQEHSHRAYILWLHEFISNLGYCNSKVPAIGTRLGLRGKVRCTARFATWTYTSFNWIHDLWYVDRVKRIPTCIAFYLTPLALAIWIMDDGTKSGSGLKLCTNSFTYEDCLILISALYKNFGLKCTINSAGAPNQYCIYIWKESMEDLRRIVSPHIVPSMKYKIDLI